MTFELDKSVLVLAHPDDEILFSLSIVQKVSLIIICFGACDDKKITEGRKNLIRDFPLKNIIFLNIPEGKRIRSYLPLIFHYETFYGIKTDTDSYPEYIENYYILREKLLEQLSGFKYVITHNPWGEYGNHQHIQLNRCITDLASILKFKVFVTGYFGGISKNLMYKTINRLNDKPIIKKNNNINLFNKLRKIYQKNNCWTWVDDYDPPVIEIFYEQEKFSFEENNKRFIPKYFQSSKLPLIYINNKIRKRSIIFSYIPFYSSLRTLLKNTITRIQRSFFSA